MEPSGTLVASDKTAPMMFHKKRLISSDPRETLVSLFEHNVFSRLALAPSANKPFVVTEWNDTFPTGYYADAMLLTTAYASLNDWDGMMLFAYGGVSAEPETPPSGIKGYFSLNNDPGTWGQFGICAAIFQEGLIRRGNNSIDLAYTAEDIFSLAQNWMSPYGYLPFVSNMRNAYLMDADKAYKGNADLVISSGFTPTGDYTSVKHALVYSRSPYSDTTHKTRGKAAFLNAYRSENGEPIMVNAAWQRLHKIGTISDKFAVLDDERPIDKMYKVYSEIVDQCMKHWGLIDQEKGLCPAGKIISDTGEMEYAYRDGYLRINTDRVQAYIGKVGFREVEIGRFSVKLDNDYMTVSFFSKDGKSLGDSGHVLMQAVGAVENSGMVWDENKLLNIGHGPVLIDQARGELYIDGALSVKAYVLDGEGNRTGELTTEKDDNGVKIILDGNTAAISYELIIERK